MNPLECCWPARRTQRVHPVTTEHTTARSQGEMSTRAVSVAPREDTVLSVDEYSSRFFDIEKQDDKVVFLNLAKYFLQIH